MNTLPLAASIEHRIGDPTLVFASQRGEERVLVSRLIERARRASGALAARGVEAGDRVVLHAGHGAEATVVLLACLRAGIVVIPLPSGSGSKELADISGELGPVLVIADEVRELPGRDVPSVSVAEIASEPGHGVPTWPPPSSAADCVIVVTSGSTGAPKGVVHSHDTLRAEIDSGWQFFGLPRGAVLEPFPAGHIGGTLGVLRACLGPTDSVFLDRWRADVAARAIADHKVVSGRGAPMFLDTLLDAAAPTDLVTLRNFLCGGAPVPPDLVLRADAAGIAAFSSYGMSEHPSIASGHPDEPLDVRVRALGTVHPGSTVQILDQHGSGADPGVEGEVVTRGAEQFLRYADGDSGRNPAGWFRTGDLGVLDRDGVLRVTGRIKDVIIRGGENISASEIEAALGRHPLVRDVAVVPAPDRRYGEQVCAFVVLAPGSVLLPADAREFFRALGLDSHKVPERIEVVADLPRTAAGKVAKQELRRRLAESAE